MDTVPSELVPEIPKFLALDDLRRAAAVSRVFYTSAWLSGLCIGHRTHWMYGESCDAEVNTLSEIVHHALRKGLRLGLAFTFGPFGASRPEGAIPGTPLEHVLSLLTAALPILDTLTLTVHDWSVPSLAGALCFAAPNLRELNMAVERTNGTSCPQVPGNIFAGAAPKLRHVGLRNLHLGQDAVAAFSRVTSVHLEYHARNSELDFALHFPAVRSLHLSYFKTPTAPPPVSYSLDGLSLQRLTVDEYDPLMLIPAILRSSTLANIPIVQYTGNNMRCDEPIWHNTAEPFKIFLEGSLTGSSRHYEPARVIVAQQDRRWQREFTLHDWRLNSDCPITAVPRLAERLSHFRMRDIYVVGFLECSGISLDALRELRIDFHAQRPYAAMLWPPDWINSLGDWTLAFGPDDESTSTFTSASYSVIYCRVLERIVLVAVSAAAVSVESREAALFARALSQCLRPKEDRAVLDLVGVELKQPLAHTLLDETLSAVRGTGFSGTDHESQPSGDDCFWDDEA